MVQHRLTEVDAENMTAICKVCGQVRIIKRGMQVANGRQRYGCAVLWTTKRFKNRYGLENLNIKEAIEASNGACSICGATEKLCVDHDHTTQKIRGVICASCNLGLGYFRDSILSLEKAITYLSA